MEPITLQVTDPDYESIPLNHSAINPNYDSYKYNLDLTTLGGEGRYIKYKIIRTQNIDDIVSKKFLKDNELYRIGIQFYNKYGQNSLPKWIGDFKCHVINNNTNLNGYYAGLELTLKPEFYIWLNDDNNFLNNFGVYDENLKPIGYRLLRAERTLLDRTILCQGIINTSMSVKVTSANENPKNGFGQIDGAYSGLEIPNGANNAKIAEADTGNKIPSLMRRFDNYLSPMWATNNYAAISRHGEPYHPEVKTNSFGIPQGNAEGGSKEIYESVSGEDKIANTRQYNSLMHLYSPDILFNEVNNIANTNLKIVGGIVNDENSAWKQTRNIETKQIQSEVKTYDSISYYDIKATGANLVNLGTGNPADVDKYSLIQALGEACLTQFYRSYGGNFIRNNNNDKYSFYGNPLIVEKGQGRTVYNNDSNYAFYNSWEVLISDGGEATNEGMRNAISRANTWGGKCMTFVLGGNSIAPKDRIDINRLYLDSDINDATVGLIGEVLIPQEQIYLGNLYGGNLYESKKRTNYIEVGDYLDIDNNILTIKNPGDTFISNFKFTKLCKTDTEIYNKNIPQFTEIVNVRVETVVDLKNRNDESIKIWDSIFQPKYEDYHKYNRVYSQQSNLIIRKDLPYTFKEANYFNNSIISSKQKFAGETIDSWTDLLENESALLNGKYGKITGLIDFKNELFAFQDRGIAFLSINPRVQISAEDNLKVQLGTGDVLDSVKYISEGSGSMNKWGIISTEFGIFYVDAFNKTFNLYDGSLKDLTSLEGLTNEFLTMFTDSNLNYFKQDNPYKNRGISLYYDKSSKDVYINLFGNNGFKKTLSYNIKQSGFSSYHDYYMPLGFSFNNKSFAIKNSAQGTIHELYTGQYNRYFDINYPSSITFVLNPEPGTECTFNNLEYISESNDNNTYYTWEKVRAFNNYQDSGLRNLVNKTNIRRLNRSWRLNIPRDQNSKFRIRDNWSKITLYSLNQDGNKLTTNDIILYYNSNDINIQ